MTRAAIIRNLRPFAVALICFPIFFTGSTIARWEGALLLGYYVAYTAYLVLTATRHHLLEPFRGALASFVLPLTAATLLVLTIRHWRDARRRSQSPNESPSDAAVNAAD